MNLVQHCELCSLQEMDYIEGARCALTQTKPNFKRTCPDIQLEQKLTAKIKAVNIAYERVRRTRTVTFVYSTVFSLIGIATIIGAYLLGTYVFDNGVISIVPLLIMLVGLVVLAMAFGPLNTYQRDIALTKRQKQKLDKLLKLYHRSYVINVSFGKEIHGDVEVDVHLEIKKTFVSPYEQIH
ncbi:hypothetical protein [Spongiimicrobium salis]|uniref:hypothetical protein n=1 Tax=Spongiimicrobium salis TaxID=1667022 RepID=UPI00374D49FA